MALIIPPRYKQKLLPETTEIAIKQIKELFQTELSYALNLRRVTAPLFVLSGTGLNDDLSGVEHAVSFNIDAMGVLGPKWYIRLPNGNVQSWLLTILRQGSGFTRI